MPDHSHDNESCFQCNRPGRPHCPLCGSTRVYGFARKRNTVTRPDGSTEELRVFRCLTCSNIYNDDDWRLRCTAPRVQASQRGRPHTDASANKNIIFDPKIAPYDVSEATRLVDEVRKKRGLA